MAKTRKGKPTKGRVGGTSEGPKTAPECRDKASSPVRLPADQNGLTAQPKHGLAPAPGKLSARSQNHPKDTPGVGKVSPAKAPNSAGPSTTAGSQCSSRQNEQGSTTPGSNDYTRVDRKGERRWKERNRQHSGTIIWRWEAVEIHPQQDGPFTGQLFPVGGEGLRVLTRARFFLIAAMIRNQVIEYPIYSYGDQGLQGKGKLMKSHHASIWVKGMSNFKNQVPYERVLTVASWHHRPELRATSVVRLTQPKFRNRNIGNIKVAGCLADDSRKEFLRRATRYLNPHYPQDR